MTETTKPRRQNIMAVWARIVSGLIGASLLVLGVLAVFKTDGEVAPSFLLAAGALFAYLSLTGVMVAKASIGSSAVEFHPDLALAQDTMNDPNAPEEVQETVAEGLAHEPESLPPAVVTAIVNVRRRASRKRALLGSIAVEAQIPAVELGVGSSVPSVFFRDLATRFEVSDESSTSMPAIARRLVEKAGLNWHSSFSSTGSTVTTSGLEAILEAVRRLSASA